MTSLRKWRFPILIGSGLIAAGILFYFSNAHVSSDKTQGAIGKRDVYRDGQVNRPTWPRRARRRWRPSHPRRASEFKSLAKMNQAFSGTGMRARMRLTNWPGGTTIFPLGWLVDAQRSDAVARKANLRRVDSGRSDVVNGPGKSRTSQVDQPGMPVPGQVGYRPVRLDERISQSWPGESRL